MSQPERHQDDIDTAAAEWAARLGGDALSPREKRDLIRWLSAAPAHRAALEEAQAAWAVMGRLRLGPDALAVTLPPPRVAQGRGGTWRRAAALAACVLGATWGGAAWWTGDPLTAFAADHRTNPGERKDITLADGSRVELGPASAIAIHYTDTARRIDLLSGQAFFIAAPMTAAEPRPFVVQAANGSAQALGTRFMVDRLEDGVEVAVTEHSVQVTQAHGDAHVVVKAGQSVRYGRTGLGAPKDEAIDLDTAWHQGSLVFDRVPLSEVVAHLNRHRRGAIVISGPQLAGRVVSGVFDARDPDAALETLATVLGIRTASLPLVTVLY